MVTPKAPVIPAGKPKHGDFFDPWTASPTGHQRNENKAGSSTGWRVSRIAKLSNQFRSGLSAVQNAEKENIKSSSFIGSSPRLGISNVRKGANNGEEVSNTSTQRKRIFDGLVVYVNGSTYPQISDHKLKHLLAEHGARISIHLGRKQVTHVIVGTPSGTKVASTGGSGAGGGLAGGKVQEEIARVGGCGIKYVGVEWAIESVKAGCRLPEAQFSNIKTSLSGQKTVRGNFFSVKSGMKCLNDDRGII